MFSLRSFLVALISLAAFAGLARPVDPADQRALGIDALHGGAARESGAIEAARMAGGEGLSKKVTSAELEKTTPGIGLAYGQVDATIPSPRPPHAAPTTVAASNATFGATTTAKGAAAVPTTAAKGATPTIAPPITAPATTAAPAKPTTTRPAAATPTTTRAAAATTTTRAAAAPSGWQTIFLDNFDGSTVDSSKWTVENRPATNMGEMSFYAADDVFVRDGSMIVRAQNRPMGGRNYTSGQAVTKFDFQYGRVEIRAKMPKGKGFWPALWMLPADGATSGWLPEVDIFESINNESRYFGNHHFPTGSGQSQLGPIPVYTDTTAWHVYGFDWTPQSLTWTLDGQPVVTTTNVAATNQHRMFLLITFALGGSWPGSPDGTTPWPSEMQIDYVKVMQQG